MSERVVAKLERALGSESVRVGGAAEIPLVAPAETEGFQEALALARRERLVVVPCGLRSKLDWLRAPAHVDFFLSTRAHQGVVAYEPGDGTLTARAGSTMAELAAIVAAGGHALTPDVPRPERATLGGAIGAAQSGADRLRYGPVRDHVLGVQFMLSDGTLAASGGRLVKNVTGYDLQRLLTGSHGTLGVILEASLRLFAAPERECLFSSFAADRASMISSCTRVLESPLRPISLSAARIEQPGGGWLVTARLGGRREVVDDECATLSKLWPSSSVLEGPPWPEEALLLRDKSFAASDGPVLLVESSPQVFARVVEQVEQALAAEEAAGTLRPRWLCEPGIATIEIALRPTEASAHALSNTIGALRTALIRLGARARLRFAAANPAFDPFGEPPTGLALMRRLRERLDPDGIFAAGRFLEA